MGPIPIAMLRDEELPDVCSKWLSDLGELDGITGYFGKFDLIPRCGRGYMSEASGAPLEVKRATNQHFAYNTQEHYPGDEIDFRVTYKNAAKQSVSDVYVLSFLPMKGDKQLN